MFINGREKNVSFSVHCLRGENFTDYVIKTFLKTQSTALLPVYKTTETTILLLN